MYGLSEDFDVIDRLSTVAGERGVPAAQIALAWLLHEQGVTAPIVGATKLSHLEDALDAAKLTLSPEEIARLEEPYRPHPVLGHDEQRERSDEQRDLADERPSLEPA